MELKSTEVISFINLKGGVGKTSATINIADAFSSDNKSVLVIDMDPQFNATQALLNHQYRFHKEMIEKDILKEIQNELVEKYNEEVEISDTDDSQSELNPDEEYKKELTSQLIYNRLKSQKATVRTLFTYEGLVEQQVNPSLIYNIKENLDLIPGNLDLFESLVGDTSGKHNVLQDHITEFEMRGNYDYIFIDCPPNWTILTQASLFASDYYIIPSRIDLFSSVGIGLLENLVKSTFYERKSPISTLYNVYRRELERPHVQSLGVLFTLTNDITIESKLKDKLKTEIPLDFFEAEIPYHSSVPLKFSLYNESGTKHATLKNSIKRTVLEIADRIILKQEEVKLYEESSK